MNVLERSWIGVDVVRGAGGGEEEVMYESRFGGGICFFVWGVLDGYWR